MGVTLILLLFFWPWGNDQYALPKTAAACAAMAIFFWRYPRTQGSANITPWLFLLSALAISTILSWDPGYSLFSIEHSRGLGLFQWIVCGLLFLYGLHSNPRKVDQAILWGGGTVAGLAVLQGFLPIVARAASTQGAPVVLGEALVVLFPAAWRIHPLLVALFVAAAAAAKCRSALIAMVVMAFYLLGRKR